MLKLIAQEPQWLDVLPGVRVRFAPITEGAVRAARRSFARAAGLDGQAVEDLDREALIEGGEALSRALILRGILAWDGVGDGEGNVLPVTPDTIALFLDYSDPEADAVGDRFAACERAYVEPYLARRAEKNASAAGLTGTGPVETAADDIAPSVAASETPTAAVAVMEMATAAAVPSGATTASTAKTRRKAKPGRTSSTS